MTEQDRGESRRDFLRKAAMVAWATPFILTMASQSAYAQASCAPAGSPCGTYNSVLDTCVPTNAVICCGDCTWPGAGFGCFCVDI